MRQPLPVIQKMGDRGGSPATCPVMVINGRELGDPEALPPAASGHAREWKRHLRGEHRVWRERGESQWQIWIQEHMLYSLWLRGERRIDHHGGLALKRAWSQVSARLLLT